MNKSMEEKIAGDCAFDQALDKARLEVRNGMVTVTVTIDGQETFRRFALTDGDVHADMQENVQDMVNTLLETDNNF